VSKLAAYGLLCTLVTDILNRIAFKSYYIATAVFIVNLEPNYDTIFQEYYDYFNKSAMIFYRVILMSTITIKLRYDIISIDYFIQ
jgi:hypothetical protein